MLGMHGTYEANLAMHGCDLMINIARASTTGSPGGSRISAPDRSKAHIDIDPSSINKVVRVDVPIVGDVGHVLEDLLKSGNRAAARRTAPRSSKGGARSSNGGARKCLAYRPSDTIIKPQHALERLEALTKGHDRYITTEVGQHQMWAAQYLGFEGPNRWMTSAVWARWAMACQHPSACRWPTPRHW